MTSKRMTKAQIMSELSVKTGLSKREVADVFDKLRDLIFDELGKEHGEFVLPELLKLRVKHVEAKQGVRYPDPNNPGNVIIKDRPASKKIKLTPLKRLKEAVL